VSGRAGARDVARGGGHPWCLILDGSVVKVRLDRQATAISLPFALVSTPTARNLHLLGFRGG
jgi:hypothetical protein